MQERSQLRIRDLKAREHSGSRIMNVKIPSTLVTAIDELHKQLAVSKTEVVLALLNEGLAVAQTRKRSS
jgi:hypothetical protein